MGIKLFDNFEEGHNRFINTIKNSKKAALRMQK